MEQKIKINEVAERFAHEHNTDKQVFHKIYRWHNYNDLKYKTIQAILASSGIRISKQSLSYWINQT